MMTVQSKESQCTATKNLSASSLSASALFDMAISINCNSQRRNR